MKLLWIDIETTGLQPTVDPLLELAVVITDEKLDVLYEKSWVIAPSMGEKKFNPTNIQMNSYVRSMHKDSGLLSVCFKGEDKAKVEAELVEVIKSQFGVEKALLAGSSVHFDHGFLAVQMPEVDKLLHYRHFDVSVLHRAFELWRPDLRIRESDRKAAHRALEDIRWSIHVASVYRGLFTSLMANV